jgi:hypothetical protein
VQVQLERTRGLDAQLGVPIVRSLEASAGARRTRSCVVSATAYGAIDPLVTIRALTHMDDAFGEHHVRAIDETSARYLVAPSILHNAWRDVLSGFDPVIAVQSETVELHIDDGGRYELSLRLYDVPRRPFPWYSEPLIAAGGSCQCRSWASSRTSSSRFRPGRARS